MKQFFQKLLSFIRVRAVAGGLEISDQVLRLVYFNGKTWQMAAIRLAPGVMDKGKVKDEQALVTALAQLKEKIPFARNKKKKMNVVVALSSVNIYSQTFALPILEGEDLDKAIDLNVRMLSPIDINQAYFGWGMLQRDEANLRSEISAAFVEKPLVDNIIQTLYGAGFITMGVESRALALVRILREKGAGIDGKKSYLLLNIDNTGIDFLIVRGGKLYFEYASQWNEIADEKGQVPLTKFQSTLEADLRQVMNFYGQHWQDPLAAVILSAAAFGKEAEHAISEAASLPVIRLTLVMGQPISSEWLVALGCSLRGVSAPSEEHEINLSGEAAIDTFRKEQFMQFMNLWRVIVPIVLGCLLGIMALADNYLMRTQAQIAAQVANQQGGSTEADIASLEASSTAFNQYVALVTATEGKLTGNYAIIGELEKLAGANGVTLTHVQFQGASTPILVTGSAATEPQIVSFKDAIGGDSHFGAPDLPLANIQANGPEYSFTMNVPLSPSGFR